MCVKQRVYGIITRVRNENEFNAQIYVLLNFSQSIDK